jgi:hypothetical protein
MYDEDNLPLAYILNYKLIIQDYCALSLHHLNSFCMWQKWWNYTMIVLTSFIINGFNNIDKLISIVDWACYFFQIMT